MLIEQMWPSKRLDARDLHALYPMGCVVTIEGVDVTVFTNDRGEPEPAYELYTREFKKPFRLNRSNGETIADLLQSRDTDEWNGRCIKIRPFEKIIVDRDTKKKKSIWVIDVDMQPVPNIPQLSAVKRDITGSAHEMAKRVQHQHLAGAAAPAAQGPAGGLPAGVTTGAALMTPIGIDTAATVVATFKERGKTVADFEAHLKGLGQDDLVRGRIPPDWQQLVLAKAKDFARGFPKVAAPATPDELERIKAGWRPPAVTGEVVDRTTGEVKSANHAPIDDDEISF